MINYFNLCLNNYRFVYFKTRIEFKIENENFIKQCLIMLLKNNNLKGSTTRIIRVQNLNMFDY